MQTTTAPIADAELHLWTIEPWGDVSVARGAIFADRKGRFQDGESVTTSKIIEQAGDHVKTKNSVYRLVPREETMRLISVGRAAA